MTAEENPLNTFKKDLEILRPQFEARISLIEKKSEKIRFLDNRIKEYIEAHGNDKVIIEVGGKTYATKMKTLLKARDSIFYKWACEELEQDKEVPHYFFFDRNNEYFSLILDYLRTGEIDIYSMSLKMINELYEDLKYYGIWGAEVQVYELLNEIKIIQFKGSQKYSNCGSHSIEGIDKEDNKGGICVQSPYEIKFELNFTHEIAGLEILGYKHNTSSWVASYGEGAAISLSLTENGTYTNVGTIPSGFGVSKKIVKFKKIEKAKWVKFKHNTYLGIGYIKFLKEFQV